MTPEQFRRVEEVYNAACQRAPHKRTLFLNNACEEEEPEFRRQIERMLEQEGTGKGLLDRGVAELLISELPAPGAALGGAAQALRGGRGPFHPGMLVAGRFRVESEIAEGGMGVVYRAIDEKLKQPRALKIAKPGFGSQLPPEARIALRVTHPNVCRVYEIHTAETTDGPVDILSMEFIEGGTLADYLHTNGPFAGRAALDIAQQILSGVAAAHRENLLHRDLKSRNVLLERGNGGAVRAVVTDFGLARESTAPSRAEGDGSSTTLSGTPAYMAPERWQGQSSSIASDVFALGVVLHEIVAGRRPKGEEQEPREIDPAIPARWRYVITRCLSRDPKQRFASVHAVAAALSGRAVRTRRIWLGAAAAALLAGLGTWRFVALPASPAARLAILAPDAPGADEATASLVRAAGFDLSRRLMHLRPRPPQLVVIPVEETGGVSPARTGMAKQRLGASHVLRATARPTGNNLMLRGAIVDAASGVVLRETSAEIGSASEIAPRLATLVGEAFNLPRQTQPEFVSAAAWPDYAAGLNSLRVLHFAVAIASLERAAALDPNSPLPPAGIAEACVLGWKFTSDSKWLDRGRQQIARAEAINPDSLAVHLAAGNLNLAPGSWQRAVEEFQRATQLEPGNGEAWSGLARAYQGIEGRRGDAATAFLKAIAVQPGYFGPVARFGDFQRLLGNNQEAEKYFRRAVDLAPDLPVLHSNLGVLYVDMARYEDARTELTRALELEPDMRAALNNLGAIYQYQGRDPDAIRIFERARSKGPESQILALNLGDSYRRTGNRAAAAEAYRRGRGLAEKRLLENSGDAATLAFLGYFDMRLQAPATAEREMAQALHFGPQDRTVIRRAVLYYEALQQREKSLAVLQKAIPDLVRELSRQPDLASLREDPRFTAMLQPAK